eukprot:Rmarinus@m.19489
MGTLLEEDFETTIKVIVVGNGGVGKTSMIRRFCKGAYTDTYKKTIGVDFLEKHHYVDGLGEEVTLLLWDTAGQEEFDTLTRKYYRGAGACVLAFSTTDRESFLAIEKWQTKVRDECGDIACVLVQNKTDLLDQAAVTSEEAERLALKLGLKFYRTCVKDNMNVTEVFEYLSEEYVRRKDNMQTMNATVTQPAPAQPIATIGSMGDGGGVISQPPPTSTPTPATQATQPPPTHSMHDQSENRGFELTRPSKQRTGGKKKRALHCIIL